MEHNIKFLTRECRLRRLSISVININAFPYVSHHQLFDTVRWWCRCVFHFFYDTHTALEMNDCVKSEVDMTVRVIRQMRRVYRQKFVHETWNKTINNIRVDRHKQTGGLSAHVYTQPVRKP